jgi:hypothetical protein
VGHTLSWFLPFRRQLGRVPVSDIVEIWSTPTFNWRVRNSVISLRDGRKITIRKRAALDEFVAKLQVISPEIYVGDW